MRSLLIVACLALTAACTPDRPKKAKKPRADWSKQPLTDQVGGRSWTKGGGWYSDDPRKLRKLINGLLADTGTSAQGVGHFAVTPHAGIKQSGALAAEVWARIEVPDLVILLAPDHSRTGPAASIWTEGPWHVPGAAFAIDHDVVERARVLMPGLLPSRVAFRDHEAEMALPFLAARNPNAKLVVMSFHDDDSKIFPSATAARVDVLGNGLATLLVELEDQGRDTLVIATTDLIHYESPEVVNRWDPLVLDRIAQWDVEGLRSLVADENLSTCGEVPVSIAMVAQRILGRSPIAWTAHDHSGNAGKDATRVVGYGGAAQWK